MHDVIYIPLGDTKALKEQRQELIRKFTEQGWAMHGNLELQDNFGTSVQVQVLMRST